MSTATKSRKGRRRIDDEEEKGKDEEEKGTDQEEEKEPVQAVKGNVIHTFVKFILIIFTVVTLSFTAITG